MTDTKNIKWYLRPSMVIAALLVSGPFAIPLVWMSPAFTKAAKIATTILTIVLTVWLVRICMGTYQLFMKEMQDLQNGYDMKQNALKLIAIYRNLIHTDHDQ